MWCSTIPKFQIARCTQSQLCFDTFKCSVRRYDAWDLEWTKAQKLMCEDDLYVFSAIRKRSCTLPMCKLQTKKYFKTRQMVRSQNIHYDFRCSSLSAFFLKVHRTKAMCEIQRVHTTEHVFLESTSCRHRTKASHVCSMVPSVLALQYL
jgi:hypothetical protein